MQKEAENKAMKSGPAATAKPPAPRTARAPGVWVCFSGPAPVRVDNSLTVKPDLPTRVQPEQAARLRRLCRDCFVLPPFLVAALNLEDK